MAIDPERIKALFLGAIEREDRAGRRAFLEAEAGENPELLDRVAALLAAYDQPPGALDRPLGSDPEAALGLDATQSATSPPPGTTPDDRLTGCCSKGEAIGPPPCPSSGSPWTGPARTPPSA